MLFFKRKDDRKETTEAIQAIQKDLETLKEEMSQFKLKLDTELDTVKHNFDSLVNYIETERTEEIQGEDAGNRNRFGLSENDMLNMKQDVLYLKRGLIDLIEWTKTVGPEFKTVHARIEEAKKDIKNKITYSVSRLKT